MKNHIFIPVICLLFTCEAASQILQNNLKELKLKGKVKVVGEGSYEAIDKTEEVQKEKEKYNTTICIFNKNGNLVVKEWYFSKGKPNGKDTCLYDNKGNMIEKYRYDRWGKLEMKIIYRYDSVQRLIEKSSFNQDGSLEGRSVYKYNKYIRNLNVIDEILYGKDGYRSGSYVFQYDSLWNLIKEFINTGYSYKYDNNGNMIEKLHTIVGHPDYSSTFQYEYDKKLNWVKRREFLNGAQIRVTERTIVYY